MLCITGSKWSARLEIHGWNFLQPFSAKIIILSETWSDTFMLLYSNLGWQIACKSLNSKHGIDCESLEIRCYFVINWLSARSLVRSPAFSFFSLLSVLLKNRNVYWCRLFTHTRPTFEPNVDSEWHISWCFFSLFFLSNFTTI